jgi:hypothetical protein
MQAKGAAALPHSFNITWDIALVLPPIERDF